MYEMGVTLWFTKYAKGAVKCLRKAGKYIIAKIVLKKTKMNMN